MLVIGLTGPTGAGKGTVSQLFASYGVAVIDADAVYHSLLVPPSPCLDALVARFGKEILTADGRLDRPTLGRKVFSDREALSDLNEIAHRFVMERIRAMLADLQRDPPIAALIDAPQLFEAGADRDCDVIVSVLADPKLRMQRIQTRDGIDAEMAQKRMAAQKSDAFFREHSTYVIENNTAPDVLKASVRRILSETGALS